VHEFLYPFRAEVFGFLADARTPYFSASGTSTPPLTVPSGGVSV